MRVKRGCGARPEMVAVNVRQENELKMAYDAYQTLVGNAAVNQYPIVNYHSVTLAAGGNDVIRHLSLPDGVRWLHHLPPIQEY